MDLGLSDRNVVVLGGSRGVGLHTALLLLEEGARVAILSRGNSVQDGKLASLFAPWGAAALRIAADATDPASLAAAIDHAAAMFGRIDGLVVCNHWMGPSRSFAATDDAEWDGYFQNSLMAAVRAVRDCTAYLARAEGAAIVLTTAYSARAPKPAIAAYAAFKAALENLTKSLAKSLAGDGIRVNAVAPGALRTGRYEERLERLRALEPDIAISAAETGMLRDMGMAPALQRIGDPAEVAALIVFLLSMRSSYTTGLIANVDGGTDF